jgi:hypothetical protein
MQLHFLYAINHTMATVAGPLVFNSLTHTHTHTLLHLSAST